MPDAATIYQNALEKLSKGDVPEFCFRHFPDFYRNYSQEWPRNKTLLELVGYAQRRGRLPELAQHLEAWQPLPEGQPGAPLFVNVPPMPNHFVGRETLMADLVAQLRSGQSLALAAEGLPGVGKTTTAVALAYDPKVRAHFRDGVLWGGLGHVPDVMTILAEWAEALGGDVTDKVEPETRRQAVRNLIGQRRLLLVIDDAWQLENATALRCGGPGCCHLLTTRDKGIAGQFSGNDQVCNVPTLADDPAYELLQALAPKACTADPTAAGQLAQAVGGLPLALELLGGYLADPAAPERKYSPKAMQAALDALSIPAQRLQLATQRLGSQAGPVTLQETIALSLADLRPQTQQAFYALGAFAPKPATFSWDAAQAVSQADDHHVSVLIDRNLLEAADERLALHQTLAEAAAAQLPTAARAGHYDYYLALANEDRQDWQRIERNYEQIQWAWQHAQQTVDTRALMEALRTYQQRRGLWSDSLTWAKRGLAMSLENGLRQDEGTSLNNIGNLYYRLGQPQKALDYYTQALPIHQEMGNRPGLAATLNNMGTVYNNWGQRQKALDYYTQAFTIKEQLGDRAGLATALNNIGSVYRDLGQSERALDYYHRALSISEEVGDRAGAATTLTNIGLVYNSLGQWQKALDYFNQALPIKEDIGDRAGLATALINIGSVYDSLGQREKALDYYRQALPIKEDIGDRFGQAATLTNIGSVYHRLGQRQKALDYYTQALTIKEQLGDRAGLAVTLNNIGNVYDNLGQRQNALDYYTQALPIREEVGDRSGLATTLNNIGSVYHRLGQKQKALDHFHQALTICEQASDRRGLATTLNNIGAAYDNLGQQQKALDYYTRALTACEQVGDQYGLAAVLNNIGFIYHRLGQGQKALDYYTQALPIREEVGDWPGLATSFINVGTVYYHLGQPEKALDYYHRALPIIEKVGDRYGESVTRYNLAMIYRADGRLAEAVTELRQVVELDRLVQHPDLEAHLAMLAQVEAELKQQH